MQNRKLIRIFTLAFAAVLLLLVVTAGVRIGLKKQSATEGGYILLATTTSTYDSGLLDLLIPAFTEETGIEVRVLSLGTGQALELGQRGDVDLLLVHDRATELQLIEEGHFTERYDVMYNDFVVLGPADDPAGIASMQSAAEAFSAIAAGGFPFISRGDDSGTHRLEMRLWDEGNVKADPMSAWYFAVGQGMADTLLMAHEKEAYVIADRGTYTFLKASLDLTVLFEGDPILFNQYGLMAVNPEKHRYVKYGEAVKFIDFLTSEKGRKLILAFNIAGETLFFPGGY